jgi:hypothetical protein
VVIEWFTDAMLRVVGAVIALVPWPTTLDLGDTSGAFAVMGTFNAILPVTESLAAAGLVLTVTSVLFIYRIIKIAFSHVPLIGGSG